MKTTNQTNHIELKRGLRFDRQSRKILYRDSGEWWEVPEEHLTPEIWAEVRDKLLADPRRAWSVSTKP